ncbi:MAG: PQQ-dependent sugar dehydrogenase, partial [Pseudomonadota bacterium]
MCKFTRLLLILALQIASIFTAAAYAQPAIQIHDTEKGKVRVEQMITGLDTPWAMAMLPGGKLIITEKDGRMLLVDPKVPDQKLEIDGLPRIRTVGQGGLLDVVLDPGFAENNAIYFTFADRNLFGGVGTAIASAKLES